MTRQRTEWAQQLDRELEEQTALALERTGWALQLNQEIEDRIARELQCSEELERLSWARALDRLGRSADAARYRAQAATLPP